MLMTENMNTIKKKKDTPLAMGREVHLECRENEVQ
jgi:hypothetical protein